MNYKYAHIVFQHLWMSMFPHFAVFGSLYVHHEFAWKGWFSLLGVITGNLEAVHNSA